MGYAWNIMKTLVLMIALLTGCATTLPWQDNRQDTLRQEAEYLAGLVKVKKITRVQAADRLNIKRVELVGRNPYDDEVFDYYRHLAEERDQKRLGPSESHSLMRKKLDEVRTRYHREPTPGKMPVFTNYMLSLYKLPPL